jgi:hypothetical protein
MQRLIAIGFLGYCFLKVALGRLFRVRRRGLVAFRKEYGITGSE